MDCKRKLEEQARIYRKLSRIKLELVQATTNILIESAFFNPVTIRRGAKALGISSEASYRFERGVDIEGVIYALKRALSLSLELAGGAVNEGIIDIYPEEYKAPELYP